MGVAVIQSFKSTPSCTQILIDSNVVVLAERHLLLPSDSDKRHLRRHWSAGSGSWLVPKALRERQRKKESLRERLGRNNPFRWNGRR